MSKDDRILELVVFTLTEGATRDQLLETVDAVSDWAGSQRGFISRELVHETGGERWMDLIWWRTLADAEAAAASR